MSEQTDVIEPSQIEHSIDEVWDGDLLAQRYNYLDYHFEHDSFNCRARYYADEVQSVVLFGPCENRRSIRSLASPALADDAVAYPERRFLKVSRR